MVYKTHIIYQSNPILSAAIHCGSCFSLPNLREVITLGKGLFEELPDMPFDDHTVKKGKSTIDFIFVLL